MGTPSVILQPHAVCHPSPTYPASQQRHRNKQISNSQPTRPSRRSTPSGHREERRYTEPIRKMPLSNHFHGMFEPHPEDRLRLRLHRARSVVLTAQELVEIRAAQRTFEGAYMRTALGQFSFSLVILKIFTAEFYSIGALFAIYGAAVLLVAVYRRYEGHRQFFNSESSDGAIHRRFRTSGDTVALLTVLSFCAYVALMVLTLK